MGRAAPIWKTRPQIRKGERASAIVEAVICMLLLLLITFGLLQFFYYSIAQMVTEYAAFRAARSAMVGFVESEYRREAKLKAIPASGPMRKPIDTLKSNQSYFPFSTAISQFYYERIIMMDYLGERPNLLKYHYWEEESTSEKEDENNGYSTYFDTELSEQGNTFTAKSTFYNYPWVMPFRGAFMPQTGGKVNVYGETKMSKHSTAYLE